MTVYSWQLGAELNIAWWGSTERAAMTAPWGEAQVVCLFSSVFDPGSLQAGPGNRSTVMMQHFVDYVRGANGLDGLASGGEVCAVASPLKSDDLMSTRQRRRVNWYTGGGSWPKGTDGLVSRGACRVQTLYNDGSALDMSP